MGRPGRVTLAEVAAAAGVSVMTASYTFSRPERVAEATRSKVLAAAESLAYAGPNSTARSLRRGHPGALGVVLGERLSYAFRDPQAAEFLAGAADVCADEGVGLTILPITGDEMDVRRIAEATVDGFVLWTTAEDDPVLAALAATHRPVAVHSGPAIPGATVIGINNRDAARRVASIAFARSKHPATFSFPLNRRREASISTGEPPGEVTFPVTRDRLDGFRRAAIDTGHAWADVVVAVCSRNDQDEAAAMARRLFERAPRPDAIATMSDQQAAGVLRAARQAGLRIPHDLAVSGWDDSALAEELGITTVAQSMQNQGRVAAMAALHPGRPVRRSWWKIVTRASTPTPRT